MIAGQTAEDRSIYIQGALAAIAILGMFFLFGVEAFKGQPLSVPTVVELTVTGIVAYVFGQRGVLSGFHGATNGITALAQSQNPLPIPGSRITTTTTQNGSPIEPVNPIQPTQVLPTYQNPK